MLQQQSNSATSAKKQGSNQSDIYKVYLNYMPTNQNAQAINENKIPVSTQNVMSPPQQNMQKQGAQTVQNQQNIVMKNRQNVLK